MQINRLVASNVRRLRHVEIAPSGAFNLIHGANGSGKTSLLETIHILGYGRSFRTRRFSEVVTRGETGLTAFCEVASGDGGQHAVGIEKLGRGTRVRVDGEDLHTTSGLARILPAVFIGPECTRLLEESDLRRRLLNWVMFHVEPGYLDTYQRFQRVLKQRNAALRSGVPNAQLDIWDEQFVPIAAELHRLRLGHVTEITQFASAYLSELLPMEVAVEFRPGWDAIGNAGASANGDTDTDAGADVGVGVGDEVAVVVTPINGATFPEPEVVGGPESSDVAGLGEALAANRESDRRVGFTRLGPQRADLRLKVFGSAARTVLSRGESKLLAMGLQLAQAAYFAVQRGEPPILLVDDLGTELDTENQRRFIAALHKIGGQAFITTVVSNPELMFPDAVAETGGFRAFHVEQGEFRQVL